MCETVDSWEPMPNFLQAAGVSAVVGLAVAGIWMAERVDKFAVRRFFQSLGGGSSDKGKKSRSRQQPKSGGQASGGCLYSQVGEFVSIN
jgi:hypothetical protein